MNIEELEVIGDRVIIRKIPRTPSAIIHVVEEDPDYDVYEAEILSVSESVARDYPMLHVGARVVFSRWVGSELGDHSVRVVDISAIQAVITRDDT